MEVLKAVREAVGEDMVIGMRVSAVEVKKHLHVPVAVVGMITTLEQAEEIIGSGKAVSDLS